MYMSPLPEVPFYFIGTFLGLFGTSIASVLHQYTSKQFSFPRVETKSESPTREYCSLVYLWAKKSTTQAVTSIFVSLAIPLSGILLVYGLLAKYITLHTTGLLGWLSDSVFAVNNSTIGISTPTTTSYSVKDYIYIQSLSPEGQFLGGVWSTYIAFLIVLAVMPLLSWLFMACLWFIPTSPKLRKILTVITEVCFGYSAIGIFTVTMMISITEFPPQIAAVVTPTCDAINAALGAWTGSPSASCYSVEAHPAWPGLCSLAIGSLLYIASSVIALYASNTTPSVPPNTPTQKQST